MALTVKNPLANTGDWGSMLGQEDPLEEEMATYSNILAWKIPWTEEPSGLYCPWGSKELDTTDLAQSSKLLSPVKL